MLNVVITTSSPTQSINKSINKMPFPGGLAIMAASGGIQSVPPVAVAAVIIICTARGMYEYNKLNNELRKIENKERKMPELWKNYNNGTKVKRVVKQTTKCKATAANAATASIIDPTYNIDFGELAEEFIAEYINN